MSLKSPRKNRIAISIFFFCCGFIFASWAARIPTIKELYNLDEASLGVLLFMLPLGSLIALPFAGWLIAHMGSRWMTYLSTCIYAILLFTLAQVSSIQGLGVLLFFFGFVGDLLNISVNTQALLLQEAYGRKPVMSSFHGLWSLGALSGAFSGGLIMTFSWTLSHHFLFASIIALLLVHMFVFFLIEQDKPRSEEQKILALPDRSLLLLGLICLCCAVCEGAMADWSSLYYRQVLHNTHQVSTTGYTAFALFMALGRLIGDRFTETLGFRGMLLLESFFIMGGLSLAILVQVPVAVIIGFAMVGFGVATIIPIVYSLAGRSKTMAPGTALAAVSTLGFTGFLLGPPVIGFLAEAFTLRWALLFVVMMGGWIAWMAARSKAIGTL